ncbi:MAG TPA: CHASE3 domain-containing protein, partial [Gemmatimonadaceae bacterium]|nr:CHASE3 domain-containing protein [Gemmatimonadaceae bacterium]
MGLSLHGLAQRRVLALVPAVLVLLIGALAYERARSVVSDVREADRNHAVIETSEVLLTRAIDAETGQRAYLLTGVETFLEPYQGARADINRYLDTLRLLKRGDQAQTARLDAIEKLVAERFALLDVGIVQRRSSTATVVDVERLLAGKRKMDELRAAIANLHTHEQGLLGERREAEQRAVRNAAIVIGIASVMALLLSALINLAFSRAVEDRD